MGVKWTLLLLKGLMKASECLLIAKEDSFHIELTRKKANSNSAKSSKRKSASKRSHTLSLMMAEPLGSHIQTFRSTTHQAQPYHWRNYGNCQIPERLHCDDHRW